MAFGFFDIVIQQLYRSKVGCWINEGEEARNTEIERSFMSPHRELQINLNMQNNKERDVRTFMKNELLNR